MGDLGALYIEIWDWGKEIYLHRHLATHRWILEIPR